MGMVDSLLSSMQAVMDVSNASTFSSNNQTELDPALLKVWTDPFLS